MIASRLFGLAREVVFAAMFGAGKLLDVYIAAFRIPNLLRDLFAEGALSVAFTTMFTATWEKDGDRPAWDLANLILSAMIFLMGLICVAAIAFAPAIVEVTNFGFHHVPGKFELAVRLTRLLFPFILFVSLAAAVMGMLNARFVFGVPASASTVFNIVSVVTGVALAFVFDPGAVATWPHPVFERAGALWGQRRRPAGRAGAAGDAAAVAVEARISVPLEAEPDRSAPGAAVAADVAERDRGGRGAGQCAGQQHVRLGNQRRPVLALCRLPPDAAAAGRGGSFAGHGDPAGGGAGGGAGRPGGIRSDGQRGGAAQRLSDLAGGGGPRGPWPIRSSS